MKYFPNGQHFHLVVTQVLHMLPTSVVRHNIIYPLHQSLVTKLICFVSYLFSESVVLGSKNGIKCFINEMEQISNHGLDSCWQGLVSRDRFVWVTWGLGTFLFVCDLWVNKIYNLGTEIRLDCMWIFLDCFV